MSESAEPVILSGPKTLYESAQLRDTLRSELVGRHALVLDLEISGPWDLAGLQVLVSAAATGHARDVSVRLVNVPRVCAEVAERSGLREWLAEQSDSIL